MKNTENNKTKNPIIVVNWPKSPYWFVEDICGLNTTIKPITLRVRLAKEIEKGSVIEIGHKRGGQGRPKKVYTFSPVKETAIELAKGNNIEIEIKTFPPKPIIPPQVTPSAIFGNRIAVEA